MKDVSNRPDGGESALSKVLSVITWAASIPFCTTTFTIRGFSVSAVDDYCDDKRKIGEIKIDNDSQETEVNLPKGGSAIVTLKTTQIVLDDFEADDALGFPPMARAIVTQNVNIVGGRPKVTKENRMAEISVSKNTDTLPLPKANGRTGEIIVCHKE